MQTDNKLSVAKTLLIGLLAVTAFFVVFMAYRRIEQNKKVVGIPPERVKELMVRQNGSSQAEIRVTVLVENSASRADLLGEHGLSLWIEAGGRRILFDTGPGRVLAANAATLGIDLSKADQVVLSHGHCDHTAGLPTVWERLGRAEMYVHPAALAPKFARRDDGGGRYIGVEFNDPKALAAKVGKLVLTAGPTKLAEGVWVTGEIPRRHDYEDTGGPFFLDEACCAPDPLADDQALFIETSKGLVVFLGCAHSGPVNTLDYVSRLSGGKPIYAVLGGMHLLRATPERIDKTLAALRGYNVQKIGPAHCTGESAAAAILAAFPGRGLDLHAGTSITLP